MLPGQLDLFDNTVTAPSTTAVTGTRLRLSSACGQCGNDTVIVGSSKAMHSASIHCAGCNQHRGWLSRAEFDHIAAIVGRSSVRPAEPIEIGVVR